MRSTLRLIADAREADLGSQTADTIKLNFIRCGRLSISCCGSAGPPAGRSRPDGPGGRAIGRRCVHGCVESLREVTIPISHAGIVHHSCVKDSGLTL
jgi:hypothetical protein